MIGDDILYEEISESMGYDTYCKIDDNNNNDDDNWCAFWQASLTAHDSSLSINLCGEKSVGYVGCFEALIDSSTNSYIEESSIEMRCENLHEVKLDMNITFANKVGYTIYNEYSTDYQQVLKSCINIAFSDSNYNVNESLCVSLTTSQITFNSDKCDELNSETDDTESSANIVVSVVSIVYSFQFVIYAGWLSV